MLSAVLQTKFATINKVCEESARVEIDRFYKSARYDGSKFLYPSFQDVGSVWLKLIQEKEKNLTLEIENIFDAMVMIDEEHLTKIGLVVEDLFSEVYYVDRLKRFSESIARKVASYGLPFDQDLSQLELADAAYNAGVQNLLRAARNNFFAELQLYISRRGLKMGFSSLMTDTVSLLKKDGRVFDGIKASVQRDKIFIGDATILIESGDLIRRKMSNGGEETFEVNDPGFHEKFGSILANYQMTVKKLGLPEAKSAVQNITYNIAGNNARINQNSIDNSTNVVTINPDVSGYISDLRGAVQSSDISDSEKRSAMDVIDAVDAQFQSAKPNKSVVTALLAALPHAATITTIVTSLLALF